MPSSHRPMLLLLALGMLLSGCKPVPPDDVAGPAAEAADDASTANTGTAMASPALVDLDDARSLAASDAVAPAPSTDAPAMHATQSIEEVDGTLGELEPVRTLLFSDSGLFEESMATHRLGDGRVAVLAIGRADVAAFVVHVLAAAPTQPDAGSRYVVSSLELPEPAGVLDGALEVTDWRIDPADQHVTLALDVRHDLMRPGGDPATGQPESIPVIHHVTLRFEPRDGSLEQVDG